MKYKIAICDDSDADRQYVLNMVDRWAASAGHVVHTDTFTSAENFLFHYAEESDRLIGECNYRNVADGVTEIGIKICETDCQNRGVGRKVLSMLIGWLFRNGYSKIVLDTNLTNTRAQHVYESLGFRKVRTNIDSWKDQLGQLQSSVDYELVETDFTSYI